MNHRIEKITIRLLEMTEEQAEVAEAIASIRSKIDAAKTHYRISGYADDYKPDQDWLRRARAALRHYGVKHQSILMERSTLNRELRQLRALERPVSERFVDHARIMLPKAQFDAILSAATSSMA